MVDNDRPIIVDLIALAEGLALAECVSVDGSTEFWVLRSGQEAPA